MDAAANAAGQLKRVATVEEEIKKHPHMKMEYLQTFRDWVKMQPHFPPLDDDILLLQFLRRCRYSIEMAKIKLENYLTFRTHFPDFCEGRTVNHADIKSMLSNWQHVLLPKTDPQGNIVILARALTTDASTFHPSSSLKIIATIVECHLRENGTIPGYVVILDSGNIGLGHLTKFTVMICKQLLFYVQKCAPASIKGFYNVNSSSLIQTALTFFKSVTPGNMISKVQVFPEGAMEGLYEFLPREILPEEYGGDAGTMDQLHREAYESIKRVSGYTAMDKLKIQERKRNGVEHDFGQIFGIEGSFKKLDVD